MIPDYNFYKDIYNGSKLSEDEFNQYITKGISIISQYTMDRVRESTISSFPNSISNNIQKCACELADFIFDINRVNNSLVNGLTESSINTQNKSNIKSISAGNVSISYDNTSFAKIQSQYIDDKYIKNRYKSILNSYLYPQYINGEYYNLLSWVG